MAGSTMPCCVAMLIDEEQEESGVRSLTSRIEFN